MPKALTVGEAFFAVLRAHGITRIFGNPGSNELTMLKHLPPDFTYILALQEGAAAAMADGYAQASGSIAVVNLHSSSGMGNAMGNLTNSAVARAPMVVIAGQQARNSVPLGAMLTNVSAERLADPLVKWSSEPLRPQDVPLAASRAVLSAQSHPTGPVVLSVPLDDWAKPADERTLNGLLHRRVHGAPVVADRLIQQIVDELDAARSPVLVLGPGVDDPTGWRAATRLAERCGLPVWIAPSPSRSPFPTQHPNLQGILPTSIDAVAAVLAEYDLVLAAGVAAFRYHEAGDGPVLAPGTRLIGLTADPQEASRAGAGTTYVGDPVDALDGIARLSQTVPRSVPRRTPAPLAERHAPFSAEAILDAVDQGKSADSVVVLEWTSADRSWLRLNLDRAHSYYFPANGGLGWGLPAAIGVQMATPDRPVIALIGDGAMQYTPSALWTAARYEMPVTFLVSQNQEYGALQRFAGLMDVDADDFLGISNIDVAAVGRGYGIDSRRLATLDDVTEFIAGAGAADRPRLGVVAQRSTSPQSRAVQ